MTLIRTRLSANFDGWNGDDRWNHENLMLCRNDLSSLVTDVVVSPSKYTLPTVEMMQETKNNVQRACDRHSHSLS